MNQYARAAGQTSRVTHRAGALRPPPPEPEGEASPGPGGLPRGRAGHLTPARGPSRAEGTAQPGGRAPAVKLRLPRIGGVTTRVSPWRRRQAWRGASSCTVRAAAPEDPGEATQRELRSHRAEAPTRWEQSRGGPPPTRAAWPCPASPGGRATLHAHCPPCCVHWASLPHTQLQQRRLEGTCRTTWPGPSEPPPLPLRHPC